MTSDIKSSLCNDSLLYFISLPWNVIKIHMNNSPLISIITPVYNVERYLVQCIEFIIAQTFQ